jgi:hypothetical protein
MAKLLSQGVTIYYAGIRRKFGENCGAPGDDPDANARLGLPCDLG